MTGIFPVTVELSINGVWVDVSDRARRVPPTIDRGRENESARVRPSTGTVVLDNDDGHLTPGNAESPWWPHIDRGLPVRVSVTAWGTTYRRLVGRAVSIQLSYPQPRQRDSDLPAVAWATITVAGVLRRKEQGEQPANSPLHRLVTSPEVATRILAAWPCEDGREADRVESPTPGVGSGIMALPRAADDTHPGASALPSVSGGQPGGWDLHIPTNGRLTQWRVDWFVKVPEPIAITNFPLLILSATGASAKWYVVLDNSHFAAFAWNNSEVGVVFHDTPTDADWFGPWLRLSLELRQQSGAQWTLTLSPIEGVHAGTTTTLSDSFTGTIGRPTRLANLFSEAPDGGLSVGPFIASTQQPFDWLSPADVGYAGESAADRFERLCDEEGIPAQVVGASTNSPPMGPQRAEPLTTLLQQCADVGGILYEQRDQEGLALRTRESLHNQDAAVTLDMAQRQLAQPWEPVLDDQALRNQVAAERPQGSTVVVTDPVSQQSDGRYDASLDVNVQRDDQLPHYAAWERHLGTWPGLRHPSLSSSMRAAGQAATAAWAAADIGDRITATNLPAQQHATEDALLQGYQETLSEWHWRVQVNATPYGPWEIGVAEDQSSPGVGRGRLLSTASELLDAINETATTLDVGIAAGPNWTENAAHLPFDIVFGGEEAEVTAVGSPTVVEAFTGDGATGGPSTSHVAPSVDAPGAADLLLCVWSSDASTGTYTVPGSMTAGSQTSGTWGTVADASEVLASSGATGTRTATFSTSDDWAAASLVVAGHDGATPQIEEQLADIETGTAADDIVLTTAATTRAGWWLLLAHQWYTGGHVQPEPLGDGWVEVAATDPSGLRLRWWARRVEVTGAQTVRIGGPDFVGQDDDHHARLWVVSAVGFTYQQMTVTRSTNGVVKSHPASTAVQVAVPFVLSSPGAAHAAS